jgi:PTH1 family peptidyl-tRNA hydrolase
MKLVVGLGNPGAKYDQTRHNVGFDVVRLLESQFSSGKPKKKFAGIFSEVNVRGQQVALLRPETYMNLSGTSVQPAQAFYRVADEDLLIVCDDFQLPLGQLRFRAKGSAGGQKGLADILRRVGHQEVPRLRLGIGPPPPQWDVADYVLSRFTDAEIPIIRQSVERAASAIVDWVDLGMAACMNKYNQATST